MGAGGVAEKHAIGEEGGSRASAGVGGIVAQGAIVEYAVGHSASPSGAVSRERAVYEESRVCGTTVFPGPVPCNDAVGNHCRC